MKKRFAPYLLFLVTVLLTGCAQMAEPTGGDRDSTAPEIISERTTPQNGTVNFAGDHISIAFSEYFNVKTQQIVITPALGKRPVYKTKGKRLEIDFQEPLAPNTTYTVNLSGALADITENNPVQNMQYVFSTGPFLDSLSISGKVINAFSLNGVSASTVILQPAGNDSAVFKSKPAYFLKTDKDGSFRFFHLKQGRYNVYALNDLNADLLFSQYPEDFAFLDSAVVLDTNVSGITLRQFKPVEQKTYLKSTAGASKYVQVYRFNKLVPDLKAVPLKTADTSLKFYASHASDSVFYMSLYDTLRQDTIRFSVQSGDSILDTLSFISHLSKKLSGKAGFRLNLPNEFYIGDSIFISSGTGIIADADKITITDTVSHQAIPFKIKTGFKGCSIFPQAPTDKKPVSIVCLPGAFTSPITGGTNDTIKGTVLLLPPEKTGNIRLTIEGLEKQFSRPVCIVMQDNNQRVKKIRIDLAGPVIKVDYLKPGNYSFYLFDDTDGDGEWSTGDFTLKKQPENIIRYGQVIKVKANWDQELVWKL